MTTKWIELNENNMPESNKLMWVKRKVGGIYIASRADKPLSTDTDASRNCYWYGNPVADGFRTEKNGDLKIHHHFSDVTVTHYAEIQLPTP